jgi:beta-galactosidase
MYVKKEWFSSCYDKAFTKVYEAGLAQRGDDHVTLYAKIALVANSFTPILYADVAYVFACDGSCSVEFDVKRGAGKPYLPKFGVRFVMPRENERVEYFGYGPMESYVDKRLAARLSHFHTTVSENFEHYVRPQENGSHYGCRYAAVTTYTGQGLFFFGDNVCFNASHYTPEQLTATGHDYDLKPMRETTVIIDYKQSGIGSNSCGPWLASSMQFREPSFSFRIRVLPTMGASIDPVAESLKKF